MKRSRTTKYRNYQYYTSTILHHIILLKTEQHNYLLYQLIKMPRRSSRPAHASLEDTQAAPKRRASARLSASQADKKRVKSNSTQSSKQRSTAQRSKYFEPERSDESDVSSSDSVGEDSGSNYEDEDGDLESATAQDSAPEDFSDNGDDFEGRGGKRMQGHKAISDEKALKGKELWREGVRTGLGPGKEVFIPKPKARDPGNVPYQNDTLHPNTRLFLLDLAKHNEREWFKGQLTAQKSSSIIRYAELGFSST